MVVKDCDKCKCSIVWDATAPPVKDSKREKEGKLGWFREDLSKQLHTIDRCKNFTASKEFMKEPQSVLNAQTNPNVQLAPSPLQVKEMNVVDIAEKRLREETRVNIAVLRVIEDEVTNVLGRESNPARIGMYMKLIQDMNKK